MKCPTCGHVPKWKLPEQVAARHRRIMELYKQMPPLSLKEIARQIVMPSGEPMHYTSVLYHIQGKCKCV